VLFWNNLIGNRLFYNQKGFTERNTIYECLWTHILMKVNKFSYLADLIGTISLEALMSYRTFPWINSFYSTTQRTNNYCESHQRILRRKWDYQAAKKHVQDPYSFRCMPQVHGASKDNWLCEKVFKTEINSVTDNPNIFIESDQIISGGNFHGQPLLALDLW
jgi:histidine ammonia-lyase